jgi:hypothetical protein
MPRQPEDGAHRTKVAEPVIDSSARAKRGATKGPRRAGLLFERKVIMWARTQLRLALAVKAPPPGAISAFRQW